MRFLSMAAAIVLLVGAAQPAFAQVLLALRSVPQNQEVWQQLGAEAADVVAPRLVAVEVTMSCGLYTELEASYSNGSVQSKEIPGDAATQSRLGNLFALNRSIVTVIDQPCME